MSIIYSLADQDSVNDKLALLKHSDNEVDTGLHKFIYEVASQHGLKLRDITRTSSRPMAHMVIEDTGINAAHLSVFRTYMRRTNANEIVYVYKSPMISKDKSSTNSGTDERDSTKIKSLLAAIRKNNEIPVQGALQSAMSKGIRYAIGAIRNSTNRTDSFSLKGDIAEAMTKFVLGIDTHIPNAYIDELQQKYSSHLVTMKDQESMLDTLKRFASGCTAVCISASRRGDEVNHYHVADITYDLSNECATFQTSLKRYNSLQDSPIAPVAMMIKTFMQGQERYYERANDLGLARCDNYFEDADISCGYSEYDYFWVLIPKTAP